MIRELHTARPTETVPGDFTPAHVRYRTATVCEVWHPDGPEHINVALTSARLQRKGFRVFTIHAPHPHTTPEHHA